MSDTSNNYIDKVKALLAKAESTPFMEEAQALTEKAQELMAKYAITEAMLAAAKGGGDKIDRREYIVEAPYSEAKAALVFAVGHANHCEGIYWGSAQRRRIVLVGYQNDLDNVSVLLTSLLIQSANALSYSVKFEKPAGEHGKTYSNSFLHAYASRIGNRLKEANKHAVEEYEQETSQSTALVLRDRGELVKEAYTTYFPNTRTKVLQNAWSQSGASAGRSAADRASIHKSMGNSTKGELR